MTSQETPAALETTLSLYDKTARAAAAQVISRYSTSFGLGARLLEPDQRAHISSVYAMVRIADEIVDTYRRDDAPQVLADFERQVARSMNEGFSHDLVAHAFGVTARAVGITQDMVDPFFASMRMDLTQTRHTRESFETYVYGSAEVVGEMCLAVFVNTSSGPAQIDPDLRAGARRLGSAYQKVNFLRDLGADANVLGRQYFPGIDPARLTDAQLADLVAECREDLTAAQAYVRQLPRRPATAVQTTLDVYSKLVDMIASMPAAHLAGQRVRVGTATKAALAGRNVYRALRGQDVQGASA